MNNKDLKTYTFEVEDIENISDGYHTFRELYDVRSIMFAVICNLHPEIAWKSKLHEDNTMYDGMFIVGIKTPEGQFTFHYELRHWDEYDVKEIDCAPEFDGHTSKDITRLYSLIK